MPFAATDDPNASADDGRRGENTAGRRAHPNGDASVAIAAQPGVVADDAASALAESADDNGSEDVRGVRGVNGLPEEEQQPPAVEPLIWEMHEHAGKNYRLLGDKLAVAGTFYREQNGLLQVLQDGTTRRIRNASQLRPRIVDLVPMQVHRDGKVVRELPTAEHLNAMLHTEAFLGRFLPVDEVSRVFFYHDGYRPLQHGYNDFGDGRRILYLGQPVQPVQSLDTINAFLDAMPFASNADRTNAVAAGLTIRLRRQWPGGKPLIAITSTQTHGGKTTLADFVCGPVPEADLLYEATDWPMQVQFQKQIGLDPDIGVVLFDNVRLDSAGGRARIIRSSFIESFVTSPEVILASPGAGEPVRLKNNYVVVLDTNDGVMSPDLLNRSLSSHLAPIGDIQDRKSAIGNPRLEFLPQNWERIEAEYHGMIQKWHEADSPLDNSVTHPMTPWARTIGGILQVSGLKDFLANYGTRKSADDPIRGALAILGAAQPGKPLRPMDWAKLAVAQGVASTLLPANERSTAAGRERAIGRILKRHRHMSFEANTESIRYRLELDGGFRRWKTGKNPHVRYEFKILQQEKIPEDTAATLTGSTPSVPTPTSDVPSEPVESKSHKSPMTLGGLSGTKAGAAKPPKRTKGGNGQPVKHTPSTGTSRKPVKPGGGQHLSSEPPASANHQAPFPDQEPGHSDGDQAGDPVSDGAGAVADDSANDEPSTLTL